MLLLQAFVKCINKCSILVVMIQVVSTFNVRRLLQGETWIHLVYLFINNTLVQQYDMLQVTCRTPNWRENQTAPLIYKSDRKHCVSGGHFPPYLEERAGVANATLTRIIYTYIYIIISGPNTYRSLCP